MSDRSAAQADFLQQVRAAIDADRQNAHKWQRLYDWFETNLRVKGGVPGGVTAKLLTEDKQLTNRIRKELAELDPSYIVLCLLPGTSLEDTRRILGEARLPKAKWTLILEELVPRVIETYRYDAIVGRLNELFGELKPEVVKRSDGAVTKEPAQRWVMPTTQVLVDDRIRRMVKTAILSSPAVILVGPPGTGKTTLLQEIISELQADPAKYGLKNEIREPVWTTPEESWTARDLIGGETVDDKGTLRFRPGRVLSAIREGRWLVLDEANRADMDKIFGGLLTWLSGQRVELGRASTALDAPVIELDWHDGPANTVERFEALGEASATSEPIRFLVGTEWRILGTYNALDAQRVFRFGQALGRRFVRVPIPAPSVELFAKALQDTAAGTPKPVLEAVTALYQAHKAKPETELGPALFLRLPAYVATAAAGSPSPSLGEPSAADKTGVAGRSAVAISQPTETGAEAVHDLGSSAEQLLAEAYLVNVGTWLAKLEPTELNALGERVVGAKALSRDEWNWILGLLPALG